MFHFKVRKLTLHFKDLLIIVAVSYAVFTYAEYNG